MGACRIRAGGRSPAEKRDGAKSDVVSRSPAIDAFGALGFAILLYVLDLMCRMIPDLENMKYVTPYYFSNGTDIFTSGKVEAGLAVIGIVVMAAAVLAAFGIYGRKDLAA